MMKMILSSHLLHYQWTEAPYARRSSIGQQVRLNVSTTPTPDRREHFENTMIFLFQTIIDLQSLLKSLQKTKAITMLSGFADKLLLDHKTNPYSTDDFIQIEEMIKEYMLPTSMTEEWSIRHIFVTYHQNAVYNGKQVEVCDNSNTSKTSSIKTSYKEQPTTMITNDNLMETNVNRLTDDILCLCTKMTERIESKEKIVDLCSTVMLLVRSTWRS